jgi:hypothetical protein
MDVDDQLMMGDSDMMREPIALTLLHTICANARLEGFSAAATVQYAFELADEYLLQSENRQSASSYNPPVRDAPQRTEGTGRR